MTFIRYITSSHFSLLRLLLVLALVVGANYFCLAQTSEDSKRSKFSLYLEGGTLYVRSSSSLNLEYNFFTSASENVQLNGRLGHGYLEADGKFGRFGEFLGITTLTGRNKHHFESSLGIFIETDRRGKGNRELTSPFLDLGYRFQKPGGGFIFRAKAGINGVGVGLGYAFK